MSIKPAIVIGGDGLLGKAYRTYWLQQGVQVPWTSRRQEFLDVDNNRYYLDLAEVKEGRTRTLPWQQWADQGHTSVFFAAAYTGLAACEQNPEYAYLINVKAPLLLAQEALLYGMKPIFCSSDSVFDGEKGDYTENSVTHGLHIYGKHKAELESKALKLECAIVLRLAKVYTLDLQDKTLLSEMLQLLINQKSVLAARDQIFAPIYLNDVVFVLNSLLTQSFEGLINIAGADHLSRYRLATYLAEQLDVSQDLIKDISLNDLNDGVFRPLNTALKTEVLCSYHPTPLLTVFDAAKIMVEYLRSSV